MNADQAANALGKRYLCAVCDTQVICVRKGAGRFTCHGEPMTMVEAKPLPSSD